MNHLEPSFQKWRYWLVGGLGLITVFLLFCWWEARLPDETLTFTREASSQLELAALSEKLDQVSEWKNWFHSAKEIRVMGPQNIPLSQAEQRAREGALLEIQIDPGKLSRRRIQIAARITHYVPGKLLEVEVLDDSSGKIVRIMDHLTWKIELLPNPETKQIVIRGTETAHTSHWRSRLFGRIAPRVLLNQLFYPNLMTLANPVTPPKADGLF